MKISRRTALIIHFILDECLPPILRDQKWFMWLPFKILFKNKARFFFNFKKNMPYLSKEKICNIYKKTSSVNIQRETALNDRCIIEIERNILGEKILDVGCGRGFLADILSKKCKVTACDMIISEKTIQQYPNIQFKQENIQALSFSNNEFDTVICTHTLEHVQDIAVAIKELRRVTKKRLIVVLPKQRPYLYTFDLHLNFFPYAYIVLNYMRPTNKIINQEIKELKGDWYYQEDKRFSSSI